MLKRLIKLLKVEQGFVLITSSSLISSTMGAVFLLYVATIVSVESYGKINYLLSFSSVAFALSLLGMDTTIMTLVPKRFYFCTLPSQFVGIDSFFYFCHHRWNISK